MATTINAASLAPSAEVVELPRCVHSDPADLAAWHSAFGYAEHYRKIVLANAKEIVRATAALEDVKLTEARIEDLARQHPIYLDFLARNLDGRRLYEAERRALEAAS